jgi:hypothetical protein
MGEGVEDNNSIIDVQDEGFVELDYEDGGIEYYDFTLEDLED